jgi:hypothetical protein
MHRRSPQLGILAWLVLGTASLDGVCADCPQENANPFQEAKPTPGEEKAAAEKKPSVVKLSNGNAATEADIRKALETPVEVNFIDTPLKDLITYCLAQQTKTNFWIDVEALTEEGVALDEPINLKGKPISAARVMDRVLEPLGLTWIIEDDLVQVTTIIAADEKLVTVTYPVGDLIEFAKTHKRTEHVALRKSQLETVQFGGAGGESFNGQDYSLVMAEYQTPSSWLVDLLQEMTRGPWADIHGTGGSISYLNNNLVIRQTHRVHYEVDKMVRTIRQFTKGPLDPIVISIRPPHYPVGEDANVKQALTKVISVKCKDVPLIAFLRDMAETIGSPVSIDEQNLTEEGVAIDEPLTVDLAKMPAGSLLKVVLEPLGLTGIVEDGQVRITTIIAADERIFTKIHDIRDLRAAKYAGTPLLDLLQQETSGPWGDVDGTGGSLDEPLNGLLVVWQTEKIHNEVEAILADLRTQMAETKIMPQEPEDPQALSTKFYALDTQLDPESVERAILTLVEPPSWAKNGGEGEIVLIGSQVVVKHKNEVQAEVEEFLTELRKSVQASPTGFIGGSGMFHQQSAPGQPRSGGGFFQVPSGTEDSQPNKHRS